MAEAPYVPLVFTGVNENPPTVPEDINADEIDAAFTGLANGTHIEDGKITTRMLSTEVNALFKGHVIQDNGTNKTQRENLNFVGATVSDDSGNNRTTVTISAGGLPAFSVAYSGNMYVGTLGFIDFVASKTISRVDIQLGTAPVDATFILDIHKNGVTIFTNQANRPVITSGNTTGYTTTIDVSSIANGDRLEFIVDQVGSTTPGANLGIRVSYS